MSKIIQLYSDKDKTVKAYPKTLATEVYLNDGRTDVIAKFSSVDSAIAGKASSSHNHVYTNSTPTVNNFGGIDAGSTFNNVDVKDIITALLYPYVAPTISVTPSPNGGYFEKGTSIITQSVRVSVGRKSHAITRVELKLNSTSIIIKTGSEVVNGVTFTQPACISIPAITESARFYVFVTDSSGEVTIGQSALFTPVYPFFSADNMTSTVSTSTLSSMDKHLGVKGTKTLTFTTSNKPITFTYPKDWGLIKQILDPNGFDITSSFVKTEVYLAMADDTSQYYNSYRNNNSTVTNFTIRISF